MIKPIQYFWRQLDGPQIVGVLKGIQSWVIEMFDEALEFFHTFALERASSGQLTDIGLLARFIRYMVKKETDINFYFTNSPPSFQDRHGFSSLDDRSLGGQFSSVIDESGEYIPLNTELYRRLLMAYTRSEGYAGSLTLLDDLSYILWTRNRDGNPKYQFEFLVTVEGPRAWYGDVHLYLGDYNDWGNLDMVNAVYTGLRKITYNPIPTLVIDYGAIGFIPMSGTEVYHVWSLEEPPESDLIKDLPFVPLSRTDVLNVWAETYNYPSIPETEYDDTIYEPISAEEILAMWSDD